MVTLDYLVSNDGDAPLQYLYAFHPLLRAASGDGLEWPADQPLTVAYSHRGSLGTGGTRTTWGALNRDGRPLSTRQFIPDSGRFYKYFATPLAAGRATLRRADGGTLALAWDALAQPHLAVWCWEGEHPGLNHLAPEPTTAAVDSLAQAAATGQTRAIPAHGTAAWRITLTLTP